MNSIKRGFSIQASTDYFPCVLLLVFRECGKNLKQRVKQSLNEQESCMLWNKKMSLLRFFSQFLKICAKSTKQNLTEVLNKFFSWDIFYFFIFFLFFLFFYVRYSTLVHLPLLRFHFVGGCSDLTQPRTVATTALTVRRSNHSARSYCSYIHTAKLNKKVTRGNIVYTENFSREF